MESMKAVAYMAMGSMATIMFQKFKDPMIKAMQKTMNKEKKMVNDMLEDMM